jgi:hypothetical protein
VFAPNHRECNYVQSRDAAVKELTGEDLLGCERTYQHAIRMLNAISDGGLFENNIMDDDDRKIVNKCMYCSELLSSVHNLILMSVTHHCCLQCPSSHHINKQSDKLIAEETYASRAGSI